MGEAEGGKVGLIGVTMSRIRGPLSGYLEKLRVPDWRLGGQGHLYVIDDTILPLGRYPESFVFISLFDLCPFIWVPYGS